MLNKKNIDGTKLSYTDIRSNVEKTIVFLHGNSHSLKTFNYQVESSLFSQYRLVAVDLPGHGDSEEIEDYSVPNMAKLVVKLLQEIDVNECVLVGHSLGGHIAIHALNENTFNPCGVLVISTPPINQVFDPLKCYLPSQELNYLFTEDLTDIQIEALAKFLYEKDFNIAQEVKDIKRTKKSFKTGLLKSIVEESYLDEVEILSNYQGLFSILIGEQDPIPNLEYFHDLNLSLWNDKIYKVSGGHNVHRENSSEFNGFLENFNSESFKHW